jgi:uncharacterized membrane protein YraQ (UPF0718 family)
VGDFIAAWAAYTWVMIDESALLLLFGFALAGLIRSLITPSALTSIFGRGRIRQIFSASIVGVPLPLCSCSVLPVAAQLNRSGLSREGTVSFLISTPETGADSIALSVKLLGPIFAVIRPIAALITAFVSGLAAWIFIPERSADPAIAVASDPKPERHSLLRRLWDGQVYVWTDMVPELAYYLFWGYVLAGLAAAIIPADLLREGWPAWLQYIGVIVVSLPVYVCATSSTPLAAVLLTLGILPGAVLAFLLVGPATNLTALVVQKRILGLRGTVIMTISVIVTALICGILLDHLFGESIGRAFRFHETGIEAGGTVWYDFGAAILLSFLMAYYTARHYLKRVRRKLTR